MHSSNCLTLPCLDLEWCFELMKDNFSCISVGIRFCPFSAILADYNKHSSCPLVLHLA